MFPIRFWTSLISEDGVDHVEVTHVLRGVGSVVDDFRYTVTDIGTSGTHTGRTSWANASLADIRRFENYYRLLYTTARKDRTWNQFVEDYQEDWLVIAKAAL